MTINTRRACGHNTREYGTQIHHIIMTVVYCKERITPTDDEFFSIDKYESVTDLVDHLHPETLTLQTIIVQLTFVDKA